MDKMLVDPRAMVVAVCGGNFIAIGRTLRMVGTISGIGTVADVVSSRPFAARKNYPPRCLLAIFLFFYTS